MIVADLRAQGRGAAEAGTFEDRLLQSVTWTFTSLDIGDRLFHAADERVRGYVTGSPDHRERPRRRSRCGPVLARDRRMSQLRDRRVGSRADARGGSSRGRRHGAVSVNDDLVQFARDLQQGVLLDADIEGAEQMRPEVFTRHLIDVLMEAGELEDALPCHLQTRGIEVHGYGIDDEDTLNLISTIYRGEVPPVSIPPGEINTAVRRLEAFWERCRDQPFHERLEESADAYDMALHIHQSRERIQRLRFFVVTDGRNLR